MPAALRPGARLRDDAGRWVNHNAHGATLDRQVELERATLLDFFWTADRRGLALPGDDQDLRGYLDPHRQRRVERSSWPDDFALSFVALAQHHGVPTRLLDFSYSVLVAMYFASQEIPHLQRQGRALPKRFGVWALRSAVTRPANILDQTAVVMNQPTGGLNLQTVTAPAAGNPNLKAQEGLFVFRRPPSRDPFEVVGFETFVAPPDLVQFTAPADCWRDVMRWLHGRGVDGSALFPGFDGVRRAQVERDDWS